MKLAWSWLLPSPEERPRRFLGRVLVRVLVWLIVFNLLYVVAQPFRYGGLPTVYNSFVPGRLRFPYIDDNDIARYVVYELKLPRLMADHAIAAPRQPDERRVIVLGSSEVWGYLNRPEETMPVQLDQLQLALNTGERVRFYNLGHVYPDILKELLVADYLEHSAYAPDGIILTVSPYLFFPLMETHFLLEENPELTWEMAERYGITELMTPTMHAFQTEPDWRRNNFLADRPNLAAWLQNQVYGLAWGVIQEDVRYRHDFYSPPVERQPPMTGWQDNRPGVLDAFGQLSATHDVPVWLVIMPINLDVTWFTPWMSGEAQRVGMPLLDCSELLPPGSFTNTGLHYNAAGQAALAQQIALWLAQAPDNTDANWVFPLPESLQQETLVCKGGY
jgi:hypothetical protein